VYHQKIENIRNFEYCLIILVKKEVEELTAKLGQQNVQENKEGNNSDGSGKEEDVSNSIPASGQVRF